MRYDRMIKAIEQATAQCEQRIRAIIDQATRADYNVDARILSNKMKKTKKDVKAAAKGWTPERRAAQSRRIKKLMREKARAKKG